MTIEVGAGLSLLISVITLLGLGITVVAFFLKLKWDSTKHDQEIEKLQKDLDNLGAKVDKKYDDVLQKMTEQKILNSDEIRHMLIKVDAMDKAIVLLTADMKHVSETVKELKDKLFKGAAA